MEKYFKNLHLTGNKLPLSNSGFVAFATLLIISAVTLAIAMSVSLLGVNEARNSLDVRQGGYALEIANGCLEEAFYRLKLESTYLGGQLSVGQGECNINVQGSGGMRTISVTGTLFSSSNYEKIIEADIAISGSSVVVLERRVVQ